MPATLASSIMLSVLGNVVRRMYEDVEPAPGFTTPASVSEMPSVWSRTIACLVTFKVLLLTESNWPFPSCSVRVKPDTDNTGVPVLPRPL